MKGSWYRVYSKISHCPKSVAFDKVPPSIIDIWISRILGNVNEICSGRRVWSTVGRLSISAPFWLPREMNTKPFAYYLFKFLLQLVQRKGMGRTPAGTSVYIFVPFGNRKKNRYWFFWNGSIESDSDHGEYKLRITCVAFDQETFSLRITIKWASLLRNFVLLRPPC